MRADRLHRAAVKDNDLVGLLHGGNALRDDDLGGVRDLLCECPSDERIGLGIDRARRVIEDEDLRLFQQCARDAQTLLLAARNVAAALLDVCRIDPASAG